MPQTMILRISCIRLCASMRVHPPKRRRGTYYTGNSKLEMPHLRDNTPHWQDFESAILSPAILYFAVKVAENGMIIPFPVPKTWRPGVFFKIIPMLESHQIIAFTHGELRRLRATANHCLLASYEIREDREEKRSDLLQNKRDSRYRHRYLLVISPAIMFNLTKSGAI